MDILVQGVLWPNLIQKQQQQNQTENIRVDVKTHFVQTKTSKPVFRPVGKTTLSFPDDYADSTTSQNLKRPYPYIQGGP